MKKKTLADSGIHAGNRNNLSVKTLWKMTISRILGLRKFRLQKWTQCILIAGIVIFVCAICADKLPWESDICRVSGDISVQNQQDIALLTNCLVESPNAGKGKVEPDAKGKIKTNVISFAFRKINKTRKDTFQAENDIRDEMKAGELDIEVNYIVKAYVEKGNNSKVGRNHTLGISKELYSEIPPVYDDLIKVVMNTRERCTDAADYNAIIAVHSAAYHFENRVQFRWLYGDVAKTNPYRFKLVFFIGLVTNKILQDRLKSENEQFGDTVQGNFIDAYINMTYKSIMVFNWLDIHCKGIRALFRVDDDVFINMQKVYPKWKYAQRARAKKTIMCDRLYNDLVLRTGKWAVPRSLIPGDKYEFLRCPGLFVAISVDLIHEMNVQSRKVPFFWIDDILMLGLVPNVIGDVFFYPLNKWMAGAKKSADFYSCMRQNGPECHYWLGITQVEYFQKLYGYMTGSIPTETDEFLITNKVNRKG